MSFVAGLSIGSHNAASIDIHLSKSTPIPDVTTHCVQAVGKFAVDEYNLKYDDSLSYKSISEGSYQELDDSNLKYRLIIQVIDCLGRVLTYEAIVHEREPLTDRIRTLESFTRV